MHEYGYLGAIVNEASNGSGLYDPAKSLDIAELVKTPKNILGSAMLYTTVLEHIRATTESEDPEFIHGASLPLDSHWFIEPQASLRAQDIIPYLLGKRIPLFLLVAPTNENPIIDEIEHYQERVDITPTGAVLEGWGDRADYTLSKRQMSDLAIDLRIAIDAYRQGLEIKKEDSIWQH